MTARRRIPRWIRMATTVIAAVLLGVTGLLAQEDLDALRRAAEQGDAEAQYRLGVRYETRHEVPRDETEAVRWYRMAGEQGYTSAQLGLGHRYQFGFGVPEDDAEAVRWYRMGAEQGDADTQLKLGFM